MVFSFGKVILYVFVACVVLGVIIEHSHDSDRTTIYQIPPDSLDKAFTWMGTVMEKKIGTYDYNLAERQAWEAAKFIYGKQYVVTKNCTVPTQDRCLAGN